MFQTVVVICFIFQHIHCAVVSNSELDIKTDDNFDWRNYGVITPVSDQGQLGSAMDFVIAEEVESLYAIKTKSKATLLSRNEVADCCDNPDTHQPIFDGFGCIVAIGGLCSDSTYKNHTGKCQNNTCTPIGKVTGTGNIPTGREDFMKKVIHITPIAAWIDASQSSFQIYTSGIYSDPSCSSTQLDHAVQIVGYGTEAGLNYWTVKNSWGAGWGEQGYMRIQRGQNMCGIATLAFYPIEK
ncbi:vignain [Biomphalaria pfeifferi]|uniref:Vignain n=1 Tax=Biomphalaria pfeifferi TaxID=112525 RepID=A0AAD8ASU2_BIOPF|nr:vignain [Biomphalaria pfeifferi]